MLFFLVIVIHKKKKSFLIFFLGHNAVIVKIKQITHRTRILG